MKKSGKAYYMISVVAQKYEHSPADASAVRARRAAEAVEDRGQHATVLRMRIWKKLETILSLTRDLGVNLAGVEIILNMRGKIDQMQHEVNEFMDYVKGELARGVGDWEQRLSTALVKSAPTDLVRTTKPRHEASSLTSESAQKKTS